MDEKLEHIDQRLDEICEKIKSNNRDKILFAIFFLAGTITTTLLTL